MRKNILICLWFFFLVIALIALLGGCGPRQIPSQPHKTKSAPIRETGRSFLVGNRPEARGYGLYSYLLFGSPPSSATRERYLKAIEAYLMIPDIRELVAGGLEPSRLNITYLPIDTALAHKASGEFVLEHYNYGRARVLLSALPGTHRDGPYIVSYFQPISSIETLTDRYLYQDLSSVPPHLVLSWVKEFLKQVEQERFWEEKTAVQLMLELRRIIGIMAEGLPEVQQALDRWIAWIR